MQRNILDLLDKQTKNKKTPENMIVSILFLAVSSWSIILNYPKARNICFAIFNKEISPCYS